MVSGEATWPEVMRYSYPSQPGLNQWRHSGKLELSPPTYRTFPLRCQGRASAEFEFQSSPSHDRQVLSPKPEQCLRKPATTEGLKLDPDYHNITPQIFTFQPKEIHHTKDQEGLKFNEKRKSLKLTLRLQRC